jgi:hypothetical protein
MSALMRIGVLVIAVVACLGSAAMQPRFEEPPASEPHALVKIRVAYHSYPRTLLNQTVSLNGLRVPLEPPGGTLDAPSSHAVRVPLEPLQWSFGSTFYHTVSQTTQQPYTRTEQYYCGTTYSGYGTNRYSSPRYCTRTQTAYRPVTTTQTITDAACTTAVAQTPRQGAVYLVQYDYFENGQCTVRCAEQVPQADGSFRMEPCS